MTLRTSLPRACSSRHRPPLTIVVATLLIAAVTVGAHLSPADITEHACGFDELHARTIGTRVSGISRVVRPDAPAGDANAVDELAVPSSSVNNAPWETIRIRVFTSDMDDSSRYCTKSGQSRSDFQGGHLTCGSSDVFTDAKKTTLRDFLIPAAIQMHEDRLHVQRENGNIVVDAASYKSDSVCSQFTIPTAHTITGVSGADFLLYMSAGPTSGTTIAWALTCQYFADTGRPSVGVSNVSPKYISADPQTVRVITHELLHALGFNYHLFNALGMASTASLRGKGSSPVLTSVNVVTQTRAQYGCSSQTFMELEDEGGAGTANSHWKRRSAKDELMAGISGVGHYTALTIAAMEDMGFYKGNYSNAEPMSYGQNAGCALTTSKCIVNGVSKFTEMFCSDTSNSGMTCTSDHTGIGYCATTAYSNLPTYFQYFSDSTIGGADPLMDYCPYIQAYSNTNCSVNTGLLVGNTYGVNSRCFNVPTGFVANSKSFTGQLALCAAVQCSASTYSVMVSGASTYTTCTPGATMSLSSLSSTYSSGTLTCPSYNNVCVGQVNATLYQEYIDLLGDAARLVQPTTLMLLALLLVGVLVG